MRGYCLIVIASLYITAFPLIKGSIGMLYFDNEGDLYNMFFNSTDILSLMSLKYFRNVISWKMHSHSFSQLGKYKLKQN